jgi:hypothetical protein
MGRANPAAMNVIGCALIALGCILIALGNI